jgi:hypothetical protein
MKQLLVLAAVAGLVALVAVMPAGAAQSKKGPTLRSLQAQITTLKKQVTTLKKRENDAETFAAAALTYSACSTAVTADTFQDTYTSINPKLTSPLFGAQTVVNDYGACSAFQIVRAHNQNPATTSVLSALLQLFAPSGSAATGQHFMNFTRQHGYLFGQLFVLSR